MNKVDSQLLDQLTERPYKGFSDAEKSVWAPEEGSAEAGSYHSKLCALFNS